jgi:protein gp37
MNVIRRLRNERENMGKTRIEWTDKVWNPITGCSPVSSGCANCYAKRMATRLRGRYGYPKDDPFRVTFHPERLDDPARWKKPLRIFVCSMGDLFYYGKSFHVEEHHIRQAEIFKMMKSNPRHTYLLLTKRPDNMAWWAKRFTGWWGSIPDNWWLGVSVEDQKTKPRIDILRKIPASHRFISFEPLLEDVEEINFEGISWCIVGGETGPGSRPLHPDWVRSLRNQCQAAGVPLFIKTFPVNGKLSNKVAEWPEDVRIREFPK